MSRCRDCKCPSFVSVSYILRQHTDHEGTEVETLLGLYCDHREGNLRCRAYCMGEINIEVSVKNHPGYLHLLQIPQFAFDCFEGDLAPKYPPGDPLINRNKA